MVKYFEIREEAVKLFEQSKYRKLDKLISDVCLEGMNPSEILELISFRALVDQKLRKIYWSDKVSCFERTAINRSKIGENRDIVIAKLDLNRAQIVARNRFEEDRFDLALELMRDSRRTFEKYKKVAESLFVQDEILRTKFKSLLAGEADGFRIDKFIESYETLIFKMELLLLNSEFEDEETLKTWILNAKFHFLRALAYFGNKKARVLSIEVANEFTVRGNNIKAIAATFYGLGEFGFYVNQILAKIKGE